MSISFLNKQLQVAEPTQRPKGALVPASFDVLIKGKKPGEVVFQQDGITAPETWSQQAVQVVSHKYFRGHGEARENSVYGLVHRVVQAITNHLVGEERFAGVPSRDAFYTRLHDLILDQRFAFNSPVWFNLGCTPEPQCSACFILSVDDTMDSIADWIKNETAVFSKGSGSGVNISRVRAKDSKLSGGGTASGPISFAMTADRNAGAIKSGGKTRRAAKMLVMDDDHPDVFEFAGLKVEGERVARALIAAGYSAEFNEPGGAYELAPWQNANNTVRFRDAFMEVIQIVEVTQNEMLEFRETDLWRAVAQATWECGDPGVHFSGTINKWHTCKSSGEIRASNPCSEYLFIDNTSCNLGSFNLKKYVLPDGSFDFATFSEDCKLVAIAMDAIVSLSFYPTAEVTKQTKRFRTLGVGYANLGALIMSKGLAYDSDEARALAAEITSAMTVSVYEMSHEMGMAWGSFEGLAEGQNSLHMSDVLSMHANCAESTQAADRWTDLSESYDQCPAMRNAQATVLAPTGTIAFMMDCDTTGIEPDLSLIKSKKLVGGGNMRIINQSVEPALLALGYMPTGIEALLKELKENGEAAFLAALYPEHVPVFATAFGVGAAGISPDGHLNMMAAVQPFISGAISKTVNLPETATVEDIEATYLKAYKLGLKAVAIYRDNCKASQPMSAGDKKEVGTVTATLNLAVDEKMVEEMVNKALAERGAVREKLPRDRRALTHKFSIAGNDGFITIGFYDDGRIGEVFATLNKKGGTIDGFVDAFCKCFSLGLQYGIPAAELASKFVGLTFDPQGFTGDDRIKSTKSPVDYIARYIMRVAAAAVPEEVRIDTSTNDAPSWMATWVPVEPLDTTVVDLNAPECASCGGATKRAGACYVCTECGSTTGCG